MYRSRPRHDDTAGQLKELRAGPTRLAYKLQTLLEDTIIRLQRWVKREGHKWEPSPEYINAMSKCILAGSRLIREIRQLQESYSAAKMTDEEVSGALQPLLQQELRDMDDIKFLRLIEERESRQAARGTRGTPS